MMRRLNARGLPLAAIAVAAASLLAAADSKAVGASQEPAEPVRLYDGFSAPVGMDFDSEGNLYVANWSAGIVSRIDPDGSRSVFASGLSGPSGLAIDGDDHVFVASYSDDLVYRLTPEGERTVYVDGLATPAGLSFDTTGNLLIANRRTDEILAVDDQGQTQPVVKGLSTPVGAVQRPDGGYVVSNINGGITIISASGERTEINNVFSRPGPGIAVGPDGRVFVVDYGGTTVREVLPDGSAAPIADGLSSPAGLTLGADGQHLFAATWGDGAVYRIAIPD